MRFNYVVFGLIAGILAGYYLGIVTVEEILKAIKANLALIISAILIFIGVLVTIYLFHEKIIKFAIGANKASIQEVIEDLVEILETVSSDLGQSVQNVAAIYTAWSTRAMIFRTMVAIAVVLGGTLATYVLIKQNEILGNQNTKLDTQNGLIKGQSALLAKQNELLKSQNNNLKLQSLIQDASRYSVFAPLVSDIIKQINLEALKTRKIRDNQNDQDYQPGHEKDHSDLIKLSDELTAQIKAVLSQLEPYSYIDSQKRIAGLTQFDVDDAVLLSSEKGKIFMALFVNGIDLTSLHGADFSYADLRHKNFYDEEFNNFNMHYPIPCVFERKHDFSAVNFQYADFSGSNFGWVNIRLQEGTKLNNTKLEQSSLSIEYDKYAETVSSTLVETPIVFENVPGTPMK